MSGELELDRLDALDDDEVMAELVAVKGIGAWSAHMFLMFQLDRPDVLAVGDLGIRRAVERAYGLDALPTPAELDRAGRAVAAVPDDGLPDPLALARQHAGAAARRGARLSSDERARVAYASTRLAASTRWRNAATRPSGPNVHTCAVTSRKRSPVARTVTSSSISATTVSPAPRIIPGANEVELERGPAPRRSRRPRPGPVRSASHGDGVALRAAAVRGGWSQRTSGR